MERLTGIDATLVQRETPAQLLHVCEIVELDPATLPEPYSFEAVRADVAERVRQIPEFRRKLADSMFNLGKPVWVDDPDYDIERHCHRIAVPAPGDDAELARLCGHLASQPLDRGKPLWEMWVVEGLAGGRVAVLIKVHHAGIDADAGATIVEQLFGIDAPPPEDPDEELPEGTPATASPTRTAGGLNSVELALGGLLEVAVRPFEFWRTLPSSVPSLPAWITRQRRPVPAPRVSFNGSITGHRAIAWTQLELDRVQAVADGYDVAVPDVVLAVVSGALRMYLEDRGELPDSSLAALVPEDYGADVLRSIRTLHTDLDDPERRLKEIAASAPDTTEPGDQGGTWAQRAASAVFGSTVRGYATRRLSEGHPVVHNVVVATVPAPRGPLHFLGGRITAAYALGAVFHGDGLNVGVTVREDRIDIGLIACAELVPDLWSLVESLTDALDELAEPAVTARGIDRKP
ncbi:MAG TPA: wax ester/triacylglycerol synthase family O-acyltransferase [Aldersonia sp.]